MSISSQQEDDLFKRIDLGVKRGAARALAKHKKAGRSIAVSKNGKVVRIAPEDICIPKEFQDQDLSEKK